MTISQTANRLDLSRAVVAKDLVVAQARALKIRGVARVLESLAKRARSMGLREVE
jgi:hypothetical protein